MKIYDTQLVDAAITKLIYYFKSGEDVQILAYSEDKYYVEFLVRDVVNVVGALYSEDYYLLLLRKRDNQWWCSLLEEDIKVIQWSKENKDSIVKVSSDYLSLIVCLKEEIKVQEFIEKKLEEKK